MEGQGGGEAQEGADPKKSRSHLIVNQWLSEGSPLLRVLDGLLDDRGQGGQPTDSSCQSFLLPKNKSDLIYHM
jgi:hypothetical protein